MQQIDFFIDLKKCPLPSCTPQPPIDYFKNDIVYWEAWEVKDGRVRSATGSGQGTDTFEILNSLENLLGNFETKAWAKYIPNYLPPYDWKPRTVEQAGDLPSTSILPLGWSNVNSLYRRVEGRFNCCKTLRPTYVKREIQDNQIKN